jgi:hypothetical protein
VLIDLTKLIKTFLKEWTCLFSWQWRRDGPEAWEGKPRWF